MTGSGRWSVWFLLATRVVRRGECGSGGGYAGTPECATVFTARRSAWYGEHGATGQNKHINVYIIGGKVLEIRYLCKIAWNLYYQWRLSLLSRNIPCAII